MSKPLVCLVAAVARDGGIGHRGRLLARIPEDLRRFKQRTIGAPVVMGRKTWQSIGQPLPGRQNIVLSRDAAWHAEGAATAASLGDALALAPDVDRVFVIGGADVYALTLPMADELELTEIDAKFPADVFFPAWSRDNFRQTSQESHETVEGLRYTFASYKRVA